MLDIGQINHLKILKFTEFGAYLGRENEDEQVLLPRREVPLDADLGRELEVFVSYDSEDRLVASLRRPLIQVGQFAALKVRALEPVGAFLDWGLLKDLLLPFAEQTHPLKIGQKVVVFCYIDKSDRIAATMRLDKVVDKLARDFTEGQKVDLLIAGKTDLGFKAIIDQRAWGILYSNEVFRDLQYGEQLPGYIRKIRSDGKIDLGLESTGHHGADDIGPKIMELLEKNSGFLAINDKTSAEEIHRLFGVSKKKYKIALGGLYKKRLIEVTDEGLRFGSKKAEQE